MIKELNKEDFNVWCDCKTLSKKLGMHLRPYDKTISWSEYLRHEFNKLDIIDKVIHRGNNGKTN